MADFKVPIVNWSYGSLRSDQANKLECEMLSDVENPKKIIAILANDKKGHSYLSKRDDTEYCNNFILIRNKKTKAVRLFATDQYLMSPYRASEKTKSNSFVKKEEKSANLSSSLELSKIMGSKRNKRRILEIEKSNVKVDNIEKRLKKAIKDEAVDIEVDVKPAVLTNTAILPPCNRAADSVEDVYNIRDIMSSEVLEALEPIAKDVIKCKLSQLSVDTRFTKFVSNVLGEVDKSVLKVKMVLFADSLLKFLALPARLLNSKKVALCEYSASLSEKLQREFCVPLLDGKFTRPPSMRDKAVCYILVVLLLVYNFSVNISVLSDHLSPSDYAKLPRFMRAVGARSVGKSQVSFILKLPLAELSVAGMGKGRYGSKK